jgi:hypothetical protein
MQYLKDILFQNLTPEQEKQIQKDTNYLIQNSFNNKNRIIMKLTIREIRKILFDTEKYCVIGMYEITNKESRDFLYLKDNQEQILNVIDNDTHLLIWE